LRRLAPETLDKEVFFMDSGNRDQADVIACQQGGWLSNSSRELDTRRCAERVYRASAAALRVRVS